MNKTVLITGGAGYIGSHVMYEFLDNGYEIVVVDNLSEGNKFIIPDEVKFYQENIGNSQEIAKIIKDNNIKNILHFAGSIVVPESVENPIKYYENNSVASFNLIKTACDNGVENFIFSSTAAMYGNLRGDLDELRDPAPNNPYGYSKMLTEIMLKDCAEVSGMNFTILRYFNVVGADEKLRTGQISKKATHLLKIASEVVTGKRDKMYIFGDDYETPDGSCVRDYIHVSDLANAHYMVLEYMFNHKSNQVFNCGYGKGYSVIEVIKTIEEYLGHPINKVVGDRREGDPAKLISNPTKIKNVIGWKPKYDDLLYIIETAIKWEEKLQNMS